MEIKLSSDLVKSLAEPYEIFIIGERNEMPALWLGHIKLIIRLKLFHESEKSGGEC